MSIVTISRGSYSKGKEVAENVAQRLGYECIARDAIIDASKEFNIPEIKLIRAIHDAPSILERQTLTGCTLTIQLRRGLAIAARTVSTIHCS